MTAEHTVDVDIDDDGYVCGFTFTCSGGSTDDCHQWCADGCEETCTAPDVILWPLSADIGPVAQAPIDVHRWQPMVPPTCRIVDWLDACGGTDTYVDEDEPHRSGRHPIDVDWTGDDYQWTYREPAPEVTA